MTLDGLMKQANYVIPMCIICIFLYFSNTWARGSPATRWHGPLKSKSWCQMIQGRQVVGILDSDCFLDTVMKEKGRGGGREAAD